MKRDVGDSGGLPDGTHVGLRRPRVGVSNSISAPVSTGIRQRFETYPGDGSSRRFAGLPRTARLQLRRPGERRDDRARDAALGVRALTTSASSTS